MGFRVDSFEAASRSDSTTPWVRSRSRVEAPRRAAPTSASLPELDFADLFRHDDRELILRAMRAMASRSLPEEVATRLDELATLVSTPDWDHEHGHPVVPRTWDAVRELLSAMHAHALPLSHVHIAASGDGFVHVTWFGSRPELGRAVLEVGPDERAFWEELGPRPEDDRVDALPSHWDAIDRLAAWSRR